MEPRPTMPIPPTRPSGRSRGLARRRGFTLLEILVVIGIIMLLVAIGVIAFGALDQSGKVTTTTLANLQSMLAELQAMTSLRQQPAEIWRGTSKVPTSGNNPANLWQEPVALRYRDAVSGNVGSGQTERYDWGAVANTQLVFQMLNRVPSNKQIMTKLPGKQVHGLADAANKGDKLIPGPGTEKRIDPPLVLDAWNNPIIFVGSGGLRGVNLIPRSGGGTSGQQYEKENMTITSAGMFEPAATLPVSSRPFFASAGPDGDFKTGDDNLYSFQ